VIYPSIPGTEDLGLLICAAAAARTAGVGIWSSDQILLAYEYRAMEKLFQITRDKVNNVPLKVDERSWRERYCADMRTRVLHGPVHYVGIDPQYRLWIWPQDLNQAVGHFNLTPAPQLVDPPEQPAPIHRRAADTDVAVGLTGPGAGSVRMDDGCISDHVRAPLDLLLPGRVVLFETMDDVHGAVRGDALSWADAEFSEEADRIGQQLVEIRTVDIDVVDGKVVLHSGHSGPGELTQLRDDVLGCHDRSPL
jgi:hypothetical protein